MNKLFVAGLTVAVLVLGVALGLVTVSSRKPVEQAVAPVVAAAPIQKAVPIATTAATSAPTTAIASALSVVDSFDLFSKKLMVNLQKAIDKDDEATPGVKRTFSNASTDVRHTDSLKAPIVGVLKFDDINICNQSQFNNVWTVASKWTVLFRPTVDGKFEIDSGSSEITQQIPADTGSASGMSAGPHDLMSDDTMRNAVKAATDSSNGSR